MSERILDNDKFRLKIGTLDRKSPVTFYVEGGTYVKALKDDDIKESYDSAAYDIRRSISDFAVSNKFIENKHVSTIDVAKERLRNDKSTFLTFQCHFRQNEEMPFKKLQEIPESYAETIRDLVEGKLLENGFSCSRKRN